MLKIENVEVVGWEPAIRGMRNPKNSWAKSDSFYGCQTKANSPAVHCGDSDECYDCDHTCDELIAGPNDRKLMMQLASGGPVHAKYRRMITVYLDITAPLYWWKEFDTYKVGTVANSCSTMHKLMEKEFTLKDFSTEHIFTDGGKQIMDNTIAHLNAMRMIYLAGGYIDFDLGRFWVTDEPVFERGEYSKEDKRIWYEMIQLLGTNYNQKRTVMLNYEVLAGIYPMRKNHKLDEWHTFCDWIKSLTYSEIITGPGVTK